jgi:hypothetical protein
MYFTTIGHEGPVRDGRLPEPIGVYSIGDEVREVGEARCVGRTERRFAFWTERRFAVWKPVIHGEEVPGRWVIVGSRFIRIDGRGEGEGETAGPMGHTDPPTGRS